MPKKTELKDPVKLKKTVKSKKDNYISVVGRRKEATARVRLYPNKKGEITVNEKPIEQYFPTEWMSQIYSAPLRTCNVIGKYQITVKVNGSGNMGQLGAVTLGIARALALLDPEKNHQILRRRGYLTRDSRTRERRKVGKGGKARRSKQSPKR